jgi:hypothetical protein
MQPTTPQRTWKKSLRVSRHNILVFLVRAGEHKLNSRRVEQRHNECGATRWVSLEKFLDRCGAKYPARIAPSTRSPAISPAALRGVVAAVPGRPATDSFGVRFRFVSDAKRDVFTTKTSTLSPKIGSF